MSATPLRRHAPPDATDPEPVVKHLMTPNVVAITADADLLIAARLMAARTVRHLPVMDGGRCCGLLLEIDVIQALASTDNPLVRPPLLAGELCRVTPVVRPGDRRSVAAQLMRDSGTDAVVVCENNSVVGMLTATDLIRSLAEEAPAEPDWRLNARRPSPPAGCRSADARPTGEPVRTVPRPQRPPAPRPRSIGRS